jgi:small conductance mechanosensitive channel
MRPFLISIIEVIFKIVLLLIVAGIVGIELSIFATIIAASVFAIGMALQGSLGNFASGLIVLSLKPYEVGDYIQVEGYFGKVEEIGIFNTTIVTPGSKTMILPNGKITGDVVTNFSKKGVIRLELEVTMPYDEDFPKVQETIRTALSSIDKILPDYKVDIGIVGFDTHFIKIGVLPYVKPDDFWEVTYDSYGNIKRSFSEQGIKVAYSEGVEMGAIGK